MGKASTERMQEIRRNNEEENAAAKGGKNSGEWWKEAVVYQIYPRSFQDSNGDGIGDLRGITSRLDYLKELGIDVIWLSPVYQSPNDDNGYDISNYQEIMTEFGTMADFDALLDAAHARGIRIVMDLVVNHTSDEHPWFIESRKGKDNPYSDYYIWRDEPNNWGSCFSGPAWECDEERGQYYLHLFSRKQPDLNWDNAKVREEVFSMMNWWCRKGIDGFRMDVISMISKAPGLPDGPVGEGALYADPGPAANHGPNVHRYLKEMNEKVLSGYSLLTVGETPSVTVEEAARYTGPKEHELNMVFQFEHVDLGNEGTKWNTNRVKLTDLKRVFAKWQTGLHGRGWNSLYLDNHDQPRCVSRFGCDAEEFRVRSAKMLGTLLHMMEGTPYIYQGEELGMTNYPFTDMSEFRDIETINAYEELVNRTGTREPEELMQCFRYKSRDNARTPMQWDGSAYAGFSDAEPWIGVNPNYVQLNAKAELADPESVFHYYRKLIALRKNYPVIVYGDFRLRMEESEDVFAYQRTYGEDELYVYCSFSGKEQPIVLPEAAPGYCDTVLISNCGRTALAADDVLQPYEAVVIRRAPAACGQRQD